MSGVLYVLAAASVVRAAIAAMAMGARLPLDLRAAPADAWTSTALLAWLALEMCVVVVSLIGASDPPRERAAVWGGAAVIVGRLVVDVVGVLSLPVEFAMALLLDLVVHLALFSFWLRAIPAVVQSGKSLGGNATPLSPNGH